MNHGLRTRESRAFRIAPTTMSGLLPRAMKKRTWTHRETTHDVDEDDDDADDDDDDDVDEDEENEEEDETGV
jgi:hypothetical protein